MINATGEYALRSAVYLAQREGQAQTSAMIAEATKVPHGYLLKVLQAMVRSDLVLSQRGLHGGYVLARPAPKISVLDVLNAVDCAPERIEKCPLGIEGHVNLCPLHHLLDKAIADAELAFAKSDLETLSRSVRGVTALCGTS